MNWIEKIVGFERQAHLDFFGREFDLKSFQETLKRHGENKVKEWREFLLEPHFLPKIEMSRKAKFPGWKVKPTAHHYEVVYQGKVLRMINGELQPDKKAHWLSGETVLVDTRLKPQYKDGKQIWSNDTLLGPILENLRKSNKISNYNYGPQSSRFGVSADEWEAQVKPALNQTTNLSWRLERVVEGHIISQLYTHMPRKEDGATNTWVWYEEYFEDRSHRLYGGYSGYGGLAAVCWLWSDGHWFDGSFRPLAVL